MFFGTHDVRPTKYRMAVRVLYALSLLMVILPVESASDTFQLVGNGFCLDAKGRRLKLGPRPEFHGQELQWQSAKVGSDGSARHCEFRCRREPKCIGYMTEDSKACDIILRSDHNAANGIARHDAERRNYCWERVPGAEIDSACEVWSTWDDGRKERRECSTVQAT